VLIRPGRRIAVRMAGVCHPGPVRNEAFYSTAAQVLPTLLIALVVEMHFLWGRQIEVLREARTKRAASIMAFVADSSPAGFPRPVDRLDIASIRWVSEELRHARLYRAVRSAAWLFLVGEAAAFTVLCVGTKSWLASVAGPVTALSIAGLTTLTVFLPLRRLPEKPAVGVMPSVRAVERVRGEFGLPPRRRWSRLRRRRAAGRR
jgi:hypothetical protein